MKIVLVLGQATEIVQSHIIENYKSSIEIFRSYKTMEEAYAELHKLPTNIDKFVFSDDSIVTKTNPDIMSNLSLLKKLIQKDFFLTKEIIHISKNDKIVKHSKFILEEDLKLNNVTIFRRDTYTTKIIIDCIIKKEVSEDSVIKTRNLVRKRIVDKDFISIKSADDNETVIIKGNGIDKLFDKIDRQKDIENYLGDKLVEIKPSIPIPTEINNKPKTEDNLDINKQYDINLDVNKKCKVILVTGERRTGKTTMCYAIGKSASIKNKVLLIDACLDNMGLSYLGEILNDKNTTNVPLDLCLNKANKIVEFLSKVDTKLNLLTLNTHAKKEFTEDILPYSLGLLLSGLTPHFDTIIIDLPISKYNSYFKIVNNVDNIIVTTPLYLDNIVSLGYLIRNLQIKQTTNMNKLIVIPTDMVNSIVGINKTDISTALSYLSKLTQLEYDFTAEIKIESFNLNNDLYDILNIYMNNTDTLDMQEFINSMKEKSELNAQLQNQIKEKDIIEDVKSDTFDIVNSKKDTDNVGSINKTVKKSKSKFKTR